MAEGCYPPCTKSHSFHLNQHVWLLYARLHRQIPVIQSSLFIICASLDIWFDRRDLQNVLHRLHLLFPPTDGEEKAQLWGGKKQKSSCISGCFLVRNRQDGVCSPDWDNGSCVNLFKWRRFYKNRERNNQAWCWQTKETVVAEELERQRKFWVILILVN